MVRLACSYSYAICDFPIQLKCQCPNDIFELSCFLVIGLLPFAIAAVVTAVRASQHTQADTLELGKMFSTAAPKLAGYPYSGAISSHASVGADMCNTVSRFVTRGRCACAHHLLTAACIQAHAGCPF